MSFKETKFAYRHKPTGKWVHINWFFDDDLWEEDKSPYVYEMELVDDFLNATKEDENNLRSDLKVSTMNGEKYAAQNFQEFELVEIEIEYKIKQ
jgi:hypothetical protein